jgi:carbon monoxide dehydrogenase subunit G
MKLEGKAQLPGAAVQVWNLFSDPAAVAGLLPGCELLETDSAGRSHVNIKFGIAAISGKYSGWFELTEKKQPRSMRIRLEGKGAPGFVSGSGSIRLAEKDGQTEVAYSGEAQVGGMIASIGQRLIEAAARKMLQQIFADAATELRKRSSIM